MPIVTMKALLESGVHFGHRTPKWNPAMKTYIFTERNKIHIIDLQQTVKALDESYALIRDNVADGGTVLFVGTKRQAQDTIQLEATRCGMPWVTGRWLGGTLTNWRTIRLRINELERLESMRERGDFSRVTKKEALGLERKIDRLEMLLGGIRNMINIPDILFAVDVRREETAIHEANLLELPVVAMVDTNCDPRYIDYVIPSNDDAIRAIKLIVRIIADAVIEGQAMRKDIEEISLPAMEMPFEEEAELSEEDLLGEATLAKLQAQRAEEEARIAAAEKLAAERAAEEQILEPDDSIPDEVDQEAVDGVPVTETIADEVQEDDTAVDDDSDVEAPEDTSDEEVMTDVAPVDESPANDGSADDGSAEEPPLEDTADAEGPSVDEPSAVETSAEEPAEETLVENNSQEEETRADDTLTDDTSTDDTSAENIEEEEA